MQPLNFPAFQPNFQTKGDKTYIYDILRKKFILLTPEEWVRQHAVHYLIQHRGYAKSLMKVESGLQVNQMQKRSDILAYNRLGSPLLLVECKSYKVKINSGSFFQAALYNKSYQAPYLMLTNGLEHYCCFIDRGKGEIVPLTDVPEFTL